MGMNDETHRTPEEALQEIKDRISYFCAHTDGTWSPPWAREVYEIAEEGLGQPKRIDTIHPTCYSINPYQPKEWGKL